MLFPLMNSKLEAAETVESVLNSAEPALNNQEYADLRAVEEYLRNE